MSEAKTLDRKKVAAVCDNVVIYFGPQEKGQSRRERLYQTVYSHNGAALFAAQDFDANESRLEEMRIRRQQQ